MIETHGSIRQLMFLKILLLQQGQDFPGGRVTFTSEMRFISESAEKRVPCYQVLDNDGEPIVHSGVEQVFLH